MDPFISFIKCKHLRSAMSACIVASHELRSQNGWGAGVGGSSHLACLPDLLYIISLHWNLDCRLR